MKLLNWLFNIKPKPEPIKHKKLIQHGSHIKWLLRVNHKASLKFRGANIRPFSDSPNEKEAKAILVDLGYYKTAEDFSCYAEHLSVVDRDLFGYVVRSEPARGVEAECKRALEGIGELVVK